MIIRNRKVKKGTYSKDVDGIRFVDDETGQDISYPFNGGCWINDIQVSGTCDIRLSPDDYPDAA